MQIKIISVWNLQSWQTEMAFDMEMSFFFLSLDAGTGDVLGSYVLSAAGTVSQPGVCLQSNHILLSSISLKQGYASIKETSTHTYF